MDEKLLILIVIFFLLLIFYLVINLGAKNKKKSEQSKEIKTYLGGVRILIFFLSLVGLIFWIVLVFL